MFDVLKEADFSPERPVSKLLYDSDAMRVVVFGLLPGQEIPPHTAPARVLLKIVQGRGAFVTGGGESPATPGAFVVTEPNEPHGVKAAEKTVMLAVIAPRP
ncbi:MAG: cupin domain-containing protein [Deltaproteobacteria bacterium]|nr:cupin domain-containing protein [Deltaproteobacteria bacterium]